MRDDPKGRMETRWDGVDGCEISKSHTWRTQYYCCVHGVWFRSDIEYAPCPAYEAAKDAVEYVRSRMAEDDGTYVPNPGANVSAAVHDSNIGRSSNAGPARDAREGFMANIVIGPGAGRNLTRGSWNTLVGPDAGSELTTECGVVSIQVDWAERNCIIESIGLVAQLGDRVYRFRDGRLTIHVGAINNEDRWIRLPALVHGI